METIQEIRYEIPNISLVVNESNNLLVSSNASDVNLWRETSPLTPHIDANLNFSLPAALEAGEPPEARGLARDEVRLMVSHYLDDGVIQTQFRNLPDYLEAGDLLVINTSGTLNAYASDFANPTPTRSDPIRPGPLLTPTPSMAPAVTPARSSNSSNTGRSVFICWRDAISGTTPP